MLVCTNATTLLLAICLLLPTALGIKCYICNSKDQPDCDHAPQKLRLFECAAVREKPSYVRYNPLLGKASGCMKRMTAYDNTTLSVVRECYFGQLTDTVDGCLELHTDWTPMMHIMSCHICAESACNGATYNTPRSALVHASVALILIAATVNAM